MPILMGHSSPRLPKTEGSMDNPPLPPGVGRKQDFTHGSDAPSWHFSSAEYEAKSGHARVHLHSFHSVCWQPFFFFFFFLGGGGGCVQLWAGIQPEKTKLVTTSEAL